MRKQLLTLAGFAVALTTSAQQPARLTTKDYERAESMLGYSAEQLVDRANVRPNWLPGDKFWYRILTAEGHEFVLVDPATGTRTAGADLTKLGVEAPAKGEGRRGRGNEVLSPDGKKAAFIKDYNLWVRDVASGAETQLTTDGAKDFGYATDNAGWKSSDRPILAWSADSRRIATNRQDERNVGDMYLVTTNVGHPVLKAWKYPLPGDKDVAMIQRVIINVDTPKVIVLSVPADPHRATLSDDIASSGTLDDVEWTSDDSQLAFVSTNRDHRQEKFRIADAATGAVREVFEETVPTQYESGRGAINWRYLPQSGEVIWYSERDNWGHLYLYDAKTGQLKNQITIR
jgi:dipeptidyl-peptidase-4